MGEKMTLEQVRDWHLSKAAFYCDEEYPRAQQRHKKMADAIDAHLTQPAQAVDDEMLLDIARRVGLRQQFTGVNAEDSKLLLRAFVDALPALSGKQP